MRTNLIGAGRAGRDVARALISARQIALQDVVADRFESARAAVRSLGHGTPVRDLKHCGEAQLWLVGCPDDRIAQVSSQIAEFAHARDALVVHLSGSLASSILDARLSRRTSVHPARSFTGELSDALRDTFCAVEGDDVQPVSRLFSACGATLLPISPEKKAGYHRACSQASNFVVTLMGQAIASLERCGVTQDIATALTARLVAGSAESVRLHGVERALTGPIVRGDTGTVLAHIESLAGSERTAYLALAMCTIELARSSGRLSAGDSATMIAALRAQNPGERT